MAPMTMTFSVRDIPEVLAELRREIASILLAEAEGEGDPRVARRLATIAAAFEAGARPGTVQDGPGIGQAVDSRPVRQPTGRVTPGRPKGRKAAATRPGRGVS